METGGTTRDLDPVEETGGNGIRSTITITGTMEVTAAPSLNGLEG